MKMPSPKSLRKRDYQEEKQAPEVLARWENLMSANQVIDVGDRKILRMLQRMEKNMRMVKTGGMHQRREKNINVIRTTQKGQLMANFIRSRTLCYNQFVYEHRLTLPDHVA